MNRTGSYKVDIYVGGDLQQITAVCRKFAIQGACVTITPTNFVYTGCSETGAIIGFINYARFPLTTAEYSKLDGQALTLAGLLMLECCQRSCSVVTPTESIFLTNNEIKIPK